MLRESGIGRAIIKSALKDLDEISEVDVAIVGAGPSGLTAAVSSFESERFKVESKYKERACGEGAHDAGI